MDGAVDFSPEPDLHPIYPTAQQIEPLLNANSGLAPAQKAQLVSHCLWRTCQFGDHSLLSYLLTDSNAHAHVDLAAQDEDGLGLVSVTILGFGPESERDVDREECIRLLVSQGADPNRSDNAGWTPLHHAALLSPPTLVSYLLTHGCSPFSRTRRNLTPLDIITAHTVVPGREDIALLLEEAMREQGWTGGKMEQRRRVFEVHARRRGKRRAVRSTVQKELGFGPRWWGDDDDMVESSEDEPDDEETAIDAKLYTPPLDFTSMLVFSPPALPYIFHSLIKNFPPSLGNSEPANALYLLSRFACLTCDHTWLEDLIMGATDAIEETFFAHPEDITCLIFWLYNTTVWLHLMRCDESINEACELLGSFVLIEEVLNSVFVFIIRYAERRIDTLIESCLLDYSALPAELEAVQFESDWSFLRPFSNKKKTTTARPTLPLLANGAGTLRPPSPPPTAAGFLTFKQSFSRAGTSQNRATTPLQALFPGDSQATGPSPADLMSFMSALHTLMVVSGINPALITQLWSQVMYWTASETFNRVLTRKKYLSRSKAAHIGMNVSVLEEWIDAAGLPVGVKTHLAPVRDLLYWLQCHSSITEFSVLVTTIQDLKRLNPLQMRRAVRDYKYEVNEGRMTEECGQYLAQLQKDWERHRVKMGVEALRKEMDDRERDREDSIADDSVDASSSIDPDISMQSTSPPQGPNNIDVLFDRETGRTTWEPMRAPQVLGELLESRFMLPLLLPSDPRFLAALPGKPPEDPKPPLPGPTSATAEEFDAASRVSAEEKGVFAYRCRSRKLREIGVDALQWVDGYKAAARFMRPTLHQDHEPEEEEGERAAEDDEHAEDEDGNELVAPPLTRIPSTRTRAKPTPVEPKGPSAA